MAAAEQTPTWRKVPELVGWVWQLTPHLTYGMVSTYYGVGYTVGWNGTDPGMEIVPEHVGLGPAADSTPDLSIPQMSELHLDVHPTRPVLHLDTPRELEPELHLDMSTPHTAGA